VLLSAWDVSLDLLCSLVSACHAVCSLVLVGTWNVLLDAFTNRGLSACIVASTSACCASAGVASAGACSTSAGVASAGVVVSRHRWFFLLLWEKEQKYVRVAGFVLC
jgi:hypothetical protein